MARVECHPVNHANGVECYTEHHPDDQQRDPIFAIIVDQRDSIPDANRVERGAICASSGLECDTVNHSICDGRGTVNNFDLDGRG